MYVQVKIHTNESSYFLSICIFKYSFMHLLWVFWFCILHGFIPALVISDKNFLLVYLSLLFYCCVTGPIIKW